WRGRHNGRAWTCQLLLDARSVRQGRCRLDARIRSQRRAGKVEPESAHETAQNPAQIGTNLRHLATTRRTEFSWSETSRGPEVIEAMAEAVAHLVLDRWFLVPMSTATSRGRSRGGDHRAQLSRAPGLANQLAGVHRQQP